MILKNPHLLTKIEVWFPRYSDAWAGEERVALLARYKVDQASPIILIEFTKAKHLKGQRFCIERRQAQACSLDTNGKIDCYAVPMSSLKSWDSVAEVKEIINSFGW